MSKRRLLLQYILYIPVSILISAGVLSFIFHYSYNWDVDYSISFFKVSSIFLIILFYLLNVGTLIKAMKMKH